MLRSRRIRFPIVPARCVGSGLIGPHWSTGPIISPFATHWIPALAGFDIGIQLIRLAEAFLRFFANALGVVFLGLRLPAKFLGLHFGALRVSLGARGPGFAFLRLDFLFPDLVPHLGGLLPGRLRTLFASEKHHERDDRQNYNDRDDNPYKLTCIHGDPPLFVWLLRIRPVNNGIGTVTMGGNRGIPEASPAVPPESRSRSEEHELRGKRPGNHPMFDRSTRGH